MARSFFLSPATYRYWVEAPNADNSSARQNGTGHPGNRGNPIAGVATGGGIEENKWGVMATPAIHAGLGKIFVGLGGYSGAEMAPATPFIFAPWIGTI